jgi:hypothetical protein
MPYLEVSAPPAGYCRGQVQRQGARWLPCLAQKAKESGLSPTGVCISLPRDDSDSEEDWLTLKVISESLSSWEPLKDPDGVVVAGLDCSVPETQRDSVRSSGRLDMLC